MKDYYKLTTTSLGEGFLRIDGGLSDIAEFCSRSEFQHIDRNLISVEVSPDSGNVCQDFIYEDSVPLISERMRKIFDKAGVDNLFYKEVVLTNSKNAMKKLYWLALPPEIDCLIDDLCVFDFLDRPKKIVIDDDFVGSYKIFKLGGRATSDDIIITHDLASIINSYDLIGIYCIKIK